MNEIRRLFPYIKKFFPVLAGAVLMLIACGALEALIIALLAPIFNQLAPGVSSAGGDAVDRFAFLNDMLGLHGDQYFLRVALFLVVFSLFKGILLYFADYSMNKCGQKLVAGLRKEIYDHMLNQSMAFFSGNQTGKLMSKAITDVDRLQESVGKRLTDFVRQIFLLIFFLGLVFYADWKLAALSFAIAPLVLWITMRLGRKIRGDSLQSQESLAEISHALQETITGQNIVKAFSAEDYERGKFRSLQERLVFLNLKIARVSALGSPLIEFIGYAAFVPFLLYFNYQMSQGMKLGAFVVFVAALFRLYEPIRKLSRMHLYFQQTLASAQRVFGLLDTNIQVKEVENAVELPSFRESIEFQDVSFGYSGSEGPVLKGVDLKIKAGEIVALVGSSGAGKTTLVNLITRFYDAEKGRILLDGVDISIATIPSLRQQVAMVTQETFLFSGTLRENIAYSHPEQPQEDVEEAAKAAFIHDFIMELPDKYETLVGERGQLLSGGQRQRIAIARAILKKAPILILDEATSALDAESEHLVQKALYNLMQNCTTLVIAHRLSTVRMANRIVVLDRGLIVEQGNHETLIEASGVYRKLYELQFITDEQHKIGEQN
jgi:ATP-binding cassette, subfamily B, bacterial MsbA